MNVLIAADYSSPRSGNFIASLIALARAVSGKEGTVVFVFPQERQWADWIRGEGFSLELVGNDVKKAEDQFPVLSKLIEKYRIDLLHLHFGMFHHAVTHHRKEMRNVRILLHDHMGFNSQTNLIKKYVLSCARSFDYARKSIGVISVMKQKNDAYLFLRKKWYVPNGLSLERFVDHSMSRDECRESLGINDSENVCLLLGWDLQCKGLDIALKAVNECRRRGHNVVLGVIGAGKGEPSSSAASFIRQETGLDPTESWIHYFKDCEDMYAVHRAVDCYISSSRWEGFSYGLLEAISQNTPVVVSNIPGTRWAKEYDNSFFYPVENHNKCADAIIMALHAGRAETNSASVIEKYSIDHWCNRVLEIYEEL